MRASHHGVHRTHGHPISRGHPAPPGVIRSREVMRAEGDTKHEDHEPPKKKGTDDEERDYQDTLAGAGTLGAGLAAGALLL